MSMWLAALVSTDGHVGTSHVTYADTPDQARDTLADRLPAPSIRAGAYIAVWRLGNFPRQYLVTGDTDSKTVRDLGRPTMQVYS